MKNGDMPAMPYIGKELRLSENSGYYKVEAEYPGLTKREYFAAVAMQGLLASDVKSSREGFVKESVDMAYMLLKELEKRQ